MFNKLKDLLNSAVGSASSKDKKEESHLPSEGGSKKFILGLIVGHEKKAPGANLYKIKESEYSYNSGLAKLVESIAPKEMTVSIIYRDGVGISGAYSKAKQIGCDCVIELHFNAANGIASGSEVLCSYEQQDKEFAKICLDNIVKVFGLKNRGVKVLSRSDRGHQSVSSYSGMTNCLVEPFFGDNPGDCEKAIMLKAEYAKAIVDSAIQWAKKNEIV